MFLETGKCRFGDACSYVHEVSTKKKSGSKPDAKERTKPDGKKSAGKKAEPKKKNKTGRPGAMAEIAESSDEPSGEDSNNELSSNSDGSD